MRRMTKPALVVLTGLLLVAACTEESGGGSSQDEESDRRQGSYDALVAAQPAGEMSYSPTRETINFWIDTWDEPNKLSFVYLQSADGTLLGYYVLEGLPVSYCAALTPTYDVIERSGNDGRAMVDVPAPAMDGAYYSGGQCDTYYGKDATTGAYVEYTAGLGINVLLYDEPLARQNDDAQPLGPTALEDVDDIPEN